MRVVGIIPARWGSTRMPGKPLAEINGKPMIQHVYERAKKSLEHVYVATDDRRIWEVVNEFGGRAIMTPIICHSGTDRCSIAYERLAKDEGDFDVIINIQGDEPLLHSDYIIDLIKCFKNNSYVEFASVAYRLSQRDIKDTVGAVNNNNSVFVTLNKNHFALYFSRAVIPNSSRFPAMPIIHKHIGIYAYTPGALHEFCSLPKSYLEGVEKLEQLRWLENDCSIKIVVTDVDSVGVDTEEDLIKVIKLMKDGSAK